MLKIIIAVQEEAKQALLQRCRFLYPSLFLGVEDIDVESAVQKIVGSNFPLLTEIFTSLIEIRRISGIMSTLVLYGGFNDGDG